MSTAGARSSPVGLAGDGGDGGHRGPGPKQGVGRGEVGVTEPGGETSLSEVMLIFQAGGERNGVPSWGNSSNLHCCA